jgi:hypothetical protein
VSPLIVVRQAIRALRLRKNENDVLNIQSSAIIAAHQHVYMSVKFYSTSRMCQRRGCCVVVLGLGASHSVTHYFAAKSSDEGKQVECASLLQKKPRVQSDIKVAICAEPCKKQHDLHSLTTRQHHPRSLSHRSHIAPQSSCWVGYSQRHDTYDPSSCQSRRECKSLTAKAAQAATQRVRTGRNNQGELQISRRRQS